MWNVLESALEACNRTDWPDDVELREAIARTRQTLNRVRSRFEPFSVTTDSLNQAQTTISNLVGSFANAASNPTSYTGTIHQYIDQLLTQVSAWPAPDRLNLTQGIREANEQTLLHSEAVIKDLNDKLLAQRAEAADMLAAWEAESTRHLADLSSSQSDLLAQIATATTELAAQRQRLDSALNDNAATFQAAESDRAKVAAEAKKDAERAFRKEVEKIQSGGTERMTQMDGLLDQAKSTLATIGVTGTATHYETYAHQQNKVANKWRWIASAALMLSAVFFGLALDWSFRTELSWRNTLLELALGSAIAGMSGYAGSQSAGHRREERKAQRFALGLKAMSAYLATSDASKVDDLKVSLAAQLFIDDGHVEPDSKALPPTAATIDALAQALLKAAPKVHGS